MAERRLSTVYDFTSLRLHRDGTRVRQNTLNLRPRTSRVAAQDSRGNWFAREAGGFGTVPTYRRVKFAEQSEGTSATNVREERFTGPSTGDCRKAESDHGTAPNLKRRDGRPAKRVKFAHNFEYLDAPFDAEFPDASLFLDTSQPPALSPSSALPPPSSDLLKTIHYFASMYYTERGQLFNASREYRQERKERQKMRLEALKRFESVTPSPSTHSMGSWSPQLTLRDDVDTGDGNTAASAREGKRKISSKKQRGRRKFKNHRQDMYKVMDGSALVAIGMLLQEHVIRILEPHVPEGWDELMGKDSIEGSGEETTGDEDTGEPHDLNADTAAVHNEPEPVIDRSLSDGEDRNSEYGEQ